MAAIYPNRWETSETRSIYIEWDGTAIKPVQYAGADPVEPIRLDPPLPKSHRSTQLSRAAQGREARRRMIDNLRKDAKS